MGIELHHSAIIITYCFVRREDSASLSHTCIGGIIGCTVEITHGRERAQFSVHSVGMAGRYKLGRGNIFHPKKYMK
jgi:phosphate/sulfate permease